MSEGIKDFEQRLLSLEESLVGAATGQFHQIEPEHDDLLASVELGVNVVVEDLRDRVAQAERLNLELDERVKERTHELREKLDEIERQNTLIRRQQAAIQELSTPILRLWDRVIAMPIIGIIDTRRSVEITERLLAEVASSGARFAILDITGVEVVDTSTAGHLIQVVRATKLLGTDCILTGVQPVVAQTLVGIGLDLGSMLIRRDLQAALKTCLSAMNE